MSWFNAFGRRIKSLTNPRYRDMADIDEIQDPEIESSLGGFGKLLISILVFPLQVLFLPLRLLGLFHQTGVPTEDYENHQNLSFGGKLWRSTKNFGRYIVMLPYLIVTAPVRFFRGVANSGIREILFVIPALLMLGFLGYVGVQVMGRSETISNRYAKEVGLAMKDGDFKLAKTYFTRLLEDEEELSQPQKLQYMVVLRQTGEREKAEEILNELAPDDGLGLPRAHRVKALSIAFSRKDKNAPLPVEQLKIHLDRSQDDTPEIKRAWAVYYKAIDQPDKVIEVLMEGAERDPGLLLVVANYQAELNRPDDQQETLKKAEEYFQRILAKDPNNSNIRWYLANSISQQGRLDDAEEVLVKGMNRNADNIMRKANAEFFTMRHDIEQSKQNRVGRRSRYLFQALGAQPNHLPIYERLIRLASEQNSGGDSFVRVRDELNEVIATEPNAMAHFAMSNILWERGEHKKSTDHLELAYKIEPRFTIVVNNLAWVLSHQEPIDLERALELAKQAVKSKPNDGRYHDTLGTIYLKLEQYTDAAAELELALSGVVDEIAVRKKLVTAYTNLDMLEQAKLQEDLIEASNK